VAAIVCGLACALASPARAGDWLVTPFIGTMLKLDTNLDVVGPGAGTRKLTIGGSGGFLTDGIFGAEANASYVFSPFKTDNPQTITTVTLPPVGSKIATVMGDALFALPLSITHESLRPYAAVGLGVIHASVDDVIAFQPITRNLKALDVGGGAIGFINRRAGFRFDVRRFSSLATEPPIRPRFGGSQMSFWRLSVGVVIRYQ
jgi:hypothetical protein